MGRKVKNVDYDMQTLGEFAVRLNKARRPMKKGGVADLKIDLDKLGQTIRKLPKKERELVERYWGLIPGTPVLAKSAIARSKKDEAFHNMMAATASAMDKLLSIEYLRFYDEEAEELVQNLYKKMNKKGIEDMSEINAIKYFLIFLIFIVGGERMIYEEDDMCLNLKEEQIGKFDNYTLLKVTWRETARRLDDESINMKLLVDAIDMFDLKDVIAMKRYVGLPIPKEFEDIPAKQMESFMDVRLFKEKVFQYGAWDVTSILIYSQCIQKIDMSVFEKNLSLLRADWKNLEKFRTGEAIIITTEGEKTVDFYEFGELHFTDIYEVMFLYVSRRLI